MAVTSEYQDENKNSLESEADAPLEMHEELEVDVAAESKIEENSSHIEDMEGTAEVNRAIEERSEKVTDAVAESNEPPLKEKYISLSTPIADANSMVNDDAATGELPDGWSQDIDEASDRTYYYNIATGVTSWERPTVDSSKSAMAGGSGSLVENQSSHEADGDLSVDKQDEVDASFEKEELKTDLSVESKSEKENFYTGDMEGTTEVATTTEDQDEKAREDIVEGNQSVENERVNNVSSLNEDINSTVDDNVGSSKLPDGWSQDIDEASGRTYYYNMATGETSWEPPFPLSVSVDPPETVPTGALGPQDEKRNPHEVEGDFSVSKSDIADISLESRERFDVDPAVGSEIEENSSHIGDMAGSTEVISTIEEVKDNSVRTFEEDVKSTIDDNVGTIELLEGWSEHIDETTDKTYYCNMGTGETSWEPPLPLNDPVDPSKIVLTGASGFQDENRNLDEIKGNPSVSMEVTSTTNEQDEIVIEEIPEGWIKLRDESIGRDYFLNKTTNETTWNTPVTTTIPTNKELHNSAEVNGEARKLNSVLQRNRARPSHAFASFGFGGRLCLHRSGCRGKLEIHKLHSLLPSHPVVLAERKKEEHGIVGSLNGTTDDAASSYIQENVEERSSDNLWTLIQIASKSEGRLRSDEGVADTSSPESAIIQLFLQNDLETKENHDSLFSNKSEDSIPDNEALERVESLLLHGKREEAVEQAVIGNQFALALLVASMCDRTTFQNATKHFAEKVLKSGSALHTMAFLFSGQLEPPPDSELEGSSVSPTAWSDSTEQLLYTWKQHLCAIISNRIIGWDRIVLSLGDRLLELGDVHAAHCCYMVCGCPLTSVLNSSSRMTAIGCDHLVPMDVAMTTEEGVAAFGRSEAYEWAKRKGNSDAVIQSLQAFKLAYAMILADLGFREAAEDYIKSIRTCNGGAKSSASVSVEGEYPSVWALSNDELFLSFLDDFENRLSYEKNPEAITYFQDASHIDRGDNDPLGTSERSRIHTSVPPLKSITANTTDEDISFLSTKTNLFENPIDLMSPGSPRRPYDAGQESRLSGGLVNAHNENTNLNVRYTTPQVAKHPTSIIQGDKSFLETPEVHIPGKPEPFTPVPSKLLPSEVNGATNNLRSKSDSFIHTGMESAEASERSATENKKQPFPPPLGPEVNTVNAQKYEIAPQQVPMMKVVEHEKLKVATPSTVSKIQPKKKQNKPPPAPHSAPPELQKTQNRNAPSSEQKRSLIGGFRNRMTQWLNPNAKMADLGGGMDAYYDKDLQVWVFPGEDPAEKAKPIGPPPKVPVPVAKVEETNEKDTTKFDPLAAMMAPPPRAVPSIRRSDAASRPPLNSTPGIFMPPGATIPGMVKDSKAPPTFMVFTPKDDDTKESKNEEKI